MKIFYTDLDNTLIYSYRREIGQEKKGVEIYRGREVSFMTKKSFGLLKEVSKKVMVVPVTTRSVEQYQRIELGIGVPRYALTCNGGVLLKEGKRDIGWYYDSLKMVEGCREELLKAREILECDRDRSMEVRFIEELFVFTKSREPERTIHKLREELDLDKIDVMQNRVKIYAVPKILSKGSAVRRLREKLKAEYVIAAGDSEFDLTMLEEADMAVIPELLAEKWKMKERQAGKKGLEKKAEEKKQGKKGLEEKREEEKQGKEKLEKKGITQTREKGLKEKGLEERKSKKKYIIIGKEKIYSDELLEYVFEEVK